MGKNILSELLNRGYYGTDADADTILKEINLIVNQLNTLFAD